MRESAPDRIVFRSTLVRIGAFRCPVDNPSFEDSGPSDEYCFVFPRTAVAIEHEDAPPFAANPNVVTFYNQGQLYRRIAISAEGDRCDWFGVDAALVRQAVFAYDPHSLDSRPEQPFRIHRSWVDPATYLAQRRIFRLVSEGRADPLFVEEQVALLLDRVLQNAYGPANEAAVSGNDLVHRVEVLLSERWDRPDLRLADIAATVGLSVFHLCRAFRKSTGLSLHQYRHRLRLRHSLEPVCDSRWPLVEIALRAGFSSHSHFTSAFQREFAWRPSELRSNRGGERRSSLSLDH